MARNEAAQIKNQETVHVRPSIRELVRATEVVPQMESMTLQTASMGGGYEAYRAKGLSIKSKIQREQKNLAAIEKSVARSFLQLFIDSRTVALVSLATFFTAGLLALAGPAAFTGAFIAATAGSLLWFLGVYCFLSTEARETAIARYKNELMLLKHSLFTSARR